MYVDGLRHVVYHRSNKGPQHRCTALHGHRPSIHGCKVSESTYLKIQCSVSDFLLVKVRFRLQKFP